MIYIASPYSHDDPEVRNDRFEQVAKYTARLITEGHVVYSPIVHNHPLAVRYELPKSFDFWKNYDLHILKRCDEVRVLMLDGWEESKGVTEEVQFARNNKIDVEFVIHEQDDLQPVPDGADNA